MDPTQNVAPQGSAPNLSPNISITNVTKSTGGKKVAWFFGILSVIAIATAVTFAVLYFVNPKISSTENGETNNTTNQDVSIPTPSEITTLLAEKYNSPESGMHLCISISNLNCLKDNFNEDAKLEFVAINAEDSLFTSERYDNNTMNRIRNIKYEDLNNLFNKLFGENLEKESYNLDRIAVQRMEYLPDSDSFDIYFANGLGGASSARYINKIVDTKKTEKGFSATMVSINLDSISTTGGINSYTDSDGITWTTLPEEYINKVKDDISVYTLDFITENGENKLVSIEKQ